MMYSKGAGFLAHLDFLQTHYGAEGIERAKADLSAEDRQELFGRTVLAVTKLRLQAVINFILAADRLLGRGDLRLYKESLRYKAEKEFRGIYKVFMSFVSPHFIIQRVGAVWKQMYSQGAAASEFVNDHSARLTLTDVPDMPKTHDLAVVVYAEELLRISNCKNPRGVIEKSVTQGDDRCTFLFTWD
jgi:hypothetical protein